MAMETLDHSLFEAIRGNSLRGVEAALAAGANPNAREGDATAFERVHHRRNDIRCALIEAGAWDPSMVDTLVWAVDTGRASTVKKLIEQGANVNMSSFSGSPLLRAAAGGHVEMVGMLLDAGADPDAGGGFDTPLTAAAKKRDAESIRMLLKARADVEKRPQYVDTSPLAIAAALGDVEIVQALIGAGADVNRRCNAVWVSKPGDLLGAPESTPLVLAARHGHEGAVTRLLAAGADPHLADAEGQSALDRAPADVRAAMERAGVKPREASADARLLAAAEAGDADAVSALLDAGASAEARDARLATRGFTPLMLAAREGHLACVNRLIASGAALDAAEPGEPETVKKMLRHMGEHNAATIGLTLGRNPLLLALEAGHDEVAAALLAAGASPRAVDFTANEAIHLAARRGRVALLRALVAAGADAGAKGPDGVPLVIAVANGHVDATQFLLHEAPRMSGKKPSKKKPVGLDKALHQAAENCQPRLVALLLEAGADVNVSTKQSPSVLARAVGAVRYVEGQFGGKTLAACPEDDVLEIAQMLIKAGADVNRVGFMGTPLMNAARQGHVRVAKMLLEAGADPTVLSRNENALHYARLYKKSEVEALLIDAMAGRPLEEEAAMAEDSNEGAGRREARMAPVPHFETNEAFLAALDELAALCGSKAVPMVGTDGAFTLHVQHKNREAVDVEKLQGEYLARGCFVYTPEYRSEAIAVAPTTDRYAVMACMHTNGANVGLGSQDIIDWLKVLETDHPFVLTTISHSTLDGRFLSPVGDADTLAQKMYEFCPDIVDQGTETVEALARSLEESQQLFFWWD